MSHQKRKQFWVDAPLQLQMLGYVLAIVVASLAIVSFSIMRGLAQASAQSRQIFHSLDWIRETIRGPLAISSCLAILASGLITLIWSHRFAGPLRVLSAAMTRLRHGNFSVRPRVRDTDALQDVVGDFTQMQDSLRHMLLEDRKRIEAIAHRLEAAAKGDRALAELASELKAVGARLHL